MLSVYHVDSLIAIALWCALVWVIGSEAGCYVKQCETQRNAEVRYVFTCDSHPQYAVVTFG